MYCKNCNREIADGATFCPECGAPTIYQNHQQTTFERFNQQPQPQYPPTYYAPNMNMGDPAESDAKWSKIFGIISIFFMRIIFGIIAIVKAKKYEKTGNGSRASDAKVGKVCGIIGLCLGILGLIYFIFAFFTGIFLGLKEYTQNPSEYIDGYRTGYFDEVDLDEYMNRYDELDIEFADTIETPQQM